MYNDLLDKKYLIIKNFIEKARAINLGEEFENYCTANKPDGDPQVPDSCAVRNYISFLELLTEKTTQVSSILGETVLPTCSYARVYKKGNILKNHSDKPHCEVSLSVHLKGDNKWPIYFGNDTKEYLDLEPGDAVLYFGCDINHGRDEYEGETYSQCFLHYVRSRGTYSNYYFHNNRGQKSLKESEYIKVYDNVVPDELCDMIIEEYKNDEWSEATIMKGEVEKSIRNCQNIGISQSYRISKNPEYRRKLDTNIFVCTSKALQYYMDDFEYVNIERDTGYDLLRYKEGEFYEEHIDSFIHHNRSISCSLMLNDDYDGGEFSFFKRKLKFKLKKGSVIMFPSNFMFPHEILPVQKGTRYSIVTWFV